MTKEVNAMQNTFSAEDLSLLISKEISIPELEEQIAFFEKNISPLDIKDTATLSRGIVTIQENHLINRYISKWDKYRESNYTIFKFIPASGAASRMFKDLFEFLEAISDLPESDFMKVFFLNLPKFAFYNKLNEICIKNEGKGIEILLAENQFKKIVEFLLLPTGLNYGNLPKGLIKFHLYDNYERTPLEEHLVEGSRYVKDKNKITRLHFTVSAEHNVLFRSLLDSLLDKYERELNVKFDITFSEQKKSTDTLAVNMDNTPFRDEDGRLVFRPGGHGALIENLNEIEADIIFIKNIDNVIPDRLKTLETQYKKALAGYLIEIQEKIFEYLKLIDSGNYSNDQLLDILYFTQKELNIKKKDIKYLEDAELVLYLKQKLNRPIRVCGMVKNIGEPGGGPFFTANNDGTVSLQILESSQIDMENAEYKKMFEQGTHFNPVDIVCGVKDYRGNKFNLKSFIDKNTGFISLKSKNGKKLKALELPGLWNGAMSDWNTVFVEVPLKTFNPVKNVNDLLRDEHQP